MPTLLNGVVARICADDPKYAPVLKAHIAQTDDAFRNRAESFFQRYKRFVEGTGRSIDFGLECFKTLRASVHDERVNFLRTGAYANTSFEEVNRQVYSNPGIMVAYMHGLVFAQFLWPEQYRRFEFFCDNLPAYRDGIRSYLEIGGGHGLYVAEALRVLGEDVHVEVVDISATSLEVARGIVDDDRVRYSLTDIFEFPHDRHYDFITVGEVLEHLERPQDLLRQIHALLSPGGHAYITTPANAPMVDHIYLFNDDDEIRTMLQQNGFVIEREVTRYAVDLPEKRHKILKTALMYGAFVRKV